MKSISKRIAQELSKEFIDGTIFRVDLDQVDVAPAGSPGILRRLPLTGDRDKVKVGDPVKVITVAGERVALAGDLALEASTEETVADVSTVELAETIGKISLGSNNLASTGASGDAETLAGYLPKLSGADTHVLLTDTSGGITAEQATFSSIRGTTAVYCRVKRSTSQTITSYPAVSTVIPISFDTQLYEQPAGLEMWSPAAPAQMFCREAGVYCITGHLHWAANATGYRRYVLIRINGNHYVAQTGGNPHPTAALFLTVSATVPLNNGDYVEMVVMQDSGGNLNAVGSTNSLDNHYNVMEMVRLA